MKVSEIPNDADGDAIRRVFDHGSDPMRPMKVDFHVAMPNEKNGRAFAEIVASRGYEPDLSFDQELQEWTCSCSRTMLLEYDALLKCQKELDEISAPFDGFSDGWGTFGNE
ncbi:ribonuclease E inhibitor RraB [Actomonas aquatica]|uniref:Ribonuclease E inhibitor RraB n=1 Tax=Actomonas aquatica TaxID=2866162 RepID=A0ABZ1C1Z5_9BACT|nr:ribonuclease E inhibitor RraB [Opitutus sp. WL0086]WRQ85538.1 ribonuclease E inhibitor RraB [Opitutus sp. WL0086]WRQ85540.1 ribonuclease E inhibitor RraB [Opitutus sp. WL0086]